MTGWGADDDALMEGIGARDPSALATLYDRHASVLLALCVRVLRDRMEAEEVLGDVFLEVWNRHDRYARERGAPMAYLTTLTRSRALDRLRARRQRERFFPATDDSPGREKRSSEPTLEPSPREDALVAERRRRVLGALNGLTAPQRRAVELSFFDGLSHSEIALSLGAPLGTVKTRIRQGLTHLREALRDDYDAGA